MPCENAVAEAGREPLDLILNPSIHREGRTVRHVTVGPRNVPSVGGSSFVEQCRLCDQDERPLRMLPICHLAFGCSNFVERSAQMHRACHRALSRLPRNWRRQRVIDFVNTWAVSKLRQSAPVGNGHPVPRELQQLPGCYIKKDGAGGWQLTKTFNWMVDLDFAT